MFGFSGQATLTITASHTRLNLQCAPDWASGNPRSLNDVPKHLLSAGFIDTIHGIVVAGKSRHDGPWSRTAFVVRKLRDYGVRRRDR